MTPQHIEQLFLKGTMKYKQALILLRLLGHTEWRARKLLDDLERYVM